MWCPLLCRGRCRTWGWGRRGGPGGGLARTLGRGRGRGGVVPRCGPVQRILATARDRLQTAALSQRRPQHACHNCYRMRIPRSLVKNNDCRSPVHIFSLPSPASASSPAPSPVALPFRLWAARYSLLPLSFRTIKSLASSLVLSRWLLAMEVDSWLLMLPTLQKSRCREYADSGQFTELIRGAAAHTRLSLPYLFPRVQCLRTAMGPTTSYSPRQGAEMGKSPQSSAALLPRGGRRPVRLCLLLLTATSYFLLFYRPSGCEGPSPRCRVYF